MAWQKQDRMNSIPPNIGYGSQSDVDISRETDGLITSKDGDGFDVYSILHPDDTNKRSDHQTSAFETLVHLVKASVGTGLLALPLAVKNAGLAVGGVSLLLLGIIATHCMFILVNVARKMTSRYPEYKTLNYSQVTEVAVSQYVHKKLVIKLTGVIVNLFLIITQFGFCCVYFVFIADNLNQVFCSAFGVSLGAHQLSAIHAWVGVIILPLVVFCWIRNINNLSSHSTMANVFILFCLGVILYDEICLFTSTVPENQAAIIRPRNVTDDDGNDGGIEYYPTQLITAALFFGNAIYSFEGIGMILPLENKIANPNHFKPTLWLGMIIVIFLYVSVGILGYATYGASIKASITLNLDLSYDRIPESIVFLIVRLLYAYIIFASFLLQFYVPMDFLEPPFLRLLSRLPFNWWKLCYLRHQDKLDTLFQTIFRTVIVLIIAGIAVGLPDLGDLISLVGAVASSALALIFPPLLNILVFIKDDSLPRDNSIEPEGPSIQNIRYRQGSIQSSLSILFRVVWVTKDVLIMVLGVVGFGLGTYAAIHHLVHFLEVDRSVNNTCVDFFPH